MGKVAPLQIVAEVFEEVGFFPNNARLPFLLYQRCLLDCQPSSIEKIFQKNGWGHAWVNGIFDFHHYHSINHEVLGIVKGKCQVQIGGERGKTFEVEEGDVLIIPAGVSHKNLGSSVDFNCVGAYPFHMGYDMNYGQPEEFKEALQTIAQLPIPENDPVFGLEGPLRHHWK